MCQLYLSARRSVLLPSLTKNYPARERNTCRSHTVGLQGPLISLLQQVASNCFRQDGRQSLGAGENQDWAGEEAGVIGSRKESITKWENSKPDLPGEFEIPERREG